MKALLSIEKKKKKRTRTHKGAQGQLILSMNERMNEWIELCILPTVSDLIVCFLFEDNETVSGNCSLLCFRRGLCFSLSLCELYSPHVQVWMTCSLSFHLSLALSPSLPFTLFHNRPIDSSFCVRHYAYIIQKHSIQYRNGKEFEYFWYRFQF